MNHHRTVFLVVFARIFELETLWEVVVHLNCTKLPTTSKSVLHHKVKFWTVECGFTILNLCVKSLFFASFNDSLFCFFPILFRTNVLSAVCLVTKRDLRFKVLEFESFENDENDVHHVEEFLLHLIGTAENVSIVLGKSANTGKSMQFTTLFVTINSSELS